MSIEGDRTISEVRKEAEGRADGAAAGARFFTQQSTCSTWVMAESTAYEELLDRGRPDWFDLDADETAQLVKHNAARRVYRVELNGHTAYVKQHLRRGFTARLKDWFFGTPAAREFEAARYAAKRGVAAISFWARGERVGRDAPRESVSVSPAVDNVGSLSVQFTAAGLIEDAARRRQRRIDLLAASARLLAQSHNAAFLHPDNHPGNILVQEGDEEAGAGEGSLRCLYVDVYGARCGRQVSDADAARNLAALHQWFARRATRTERLRALHEYLQRRHGMVRREARRAFARRVLRESERHARALYRKRDRRIGRSNAYFAIAALGDGWHAALTLRFRNLALQVPVVPPADDGDERIAALRLRFASRGAAGGRSVLRDESDTERFFPRRAWDRWAWRVFGSPAWRRYRTAALALNRDVPCAAGLAYLERRAGLGVSESAWVRLAPDDGQALSDWLRTNGNPSRRRAVCEAIGRLLADSCRRGLAVQNPSPARLAVADRPGEAPAVYWQGIEGIALRGPFGVHAQDWLLTELARHVSRGNECGTLSAARVLRRFCFVTGRISRTDNWKTLWRRITASVDAI